jgi:hypothetical protein|tara:strand:- start:131 stop:478 length:348 start_codon:yes stop_codon:yes gene_type:complete
MKIIEYIKKIFIIALTLVSIALLVGVLFSPDIRGNFVALVTTLFDRGLVGYIVIIFLLYLYYPVYKLIINIFKVGSIGEALSLSILKNGIEKKIDTAFYLGLPILLLLFYYLGIL